MYKTLNGESNNIGNKSILVSFCTFLLFDRGEYLDWVKETLSQPTVKGIFYTVR